jgi:ribose transport system substrate-binding protein
MNKLKFLISLLTKENHYQVLLESVARETALRVGVDLEILYADNDAITQGEQLLNAIQSPAKDSRPDAILCNPVGTTLLQVARQAVAAGIGWAVLDRECEYAAELRQSSQIPVFSVGTDNAEIGRLQGRQIAALLPKGGLVLYILGPSASSTAKSRATEMQSTKPDSVQVRNLTGDWSGQSGHKAVSRWLQLSTAHTTSVNMIAAQNDDMAMGARNAFQEETRGAERERWASLPYIGCDCCPGAGEEWVRKGLLTASVVYPPTTGLAIELMLQALRSKSQPSVRTIVPPVSYPPIERLSPKTT